MSTEQRNPKYDSRQPKKPKFWQRQLVFDTITTRFFMLFIFLLVVPLVTVTIFSDSLLSKYQGQLVRNQLQLTYQLFDEYVETLVETESRLLGRTESKEAFIRSCQNQAEVNAYCLIYKSQSGAIMVVSQNINENLDGKGLTQVVDVAQHSLFSGSVFKETILLDKRVAKIFVRKSTENDDVWLKVVPVSTQLLNAMYFKYQGLKPLVILTSLQPDGMKDEHYNVFAEPVHIKMEDEFKEDVLNKIRDLADLEPLALTIKNHKVQALQSKLFNYKQQPVARVVVIEPEAWEFQTAEFYSGISFITLLSILLSVFFALFAARPITSPLVKLVKQVDALSRDTIADKRLDVKGVYEINQLNSAFNRMLSRIRKEQRMKDDFVATLTHDLKVPLIAEKQTLDYLLKGAYGELNDEQKEVMSVLSSSNQSTLTMVQGLLEVYRYQSGEVKLNLETFDLKMLLEETVQELSTYATEKEIDIIFENPDPLNDKSTEESRFNVYADRLEVRRGIQNLIANAIANTPRKGSVTCELNDLHSLGVDYIHQLTSLENSTLRQPVLLEGHVLFSIIDTGVGFSKEYLPHVFKQFGGSRGRNPLSIGLGLYNCYQIAQAHNGFLWIESTESEGAAVTMMLPTTHEVFEERRKTFDRRSR